jgi:hypothetical protein
MVMGIGMEHFSNSRGFYHEIFSVDVHCSPADDAPATDYIQQKVGTRMEWLWLRSIT